MASPEALEEIRRHVNVLKRKGKAEDRPKADAAEALTNLVLRDEELQHRTAMGLAIVAEGGIPPLVLLLRNAGNYYAKMNASMALYYASMDNGKVCKAIVDCGGRAALEAMAKDERTDADPLVKVARSKAKQTLEALRTAELRPELMEVPEPKARRLPEVEAVEAGPSSPNWVVKALESDSASEQCQAAEQLGNWAATSDDKRSEISKAGGCEALVALMVTGNDDAKSQAARALRNLANHAEAKELILKADGIAILTPLAKHGKGKVKETAGEALNLLLVDAKAAPVADTKPEPTPTSIPTGEGTKVAMFSARFDGGPVEKKFREVFRILRDHKYDVLMVTADAGESFADLTTEYLGRLQREEGTMLAVCTKHYGEMTDSAYSSHKELKFALDYEKFVQVLPLKVEDTYPPQPPGGPEHKHDKKCLAQGYVLSVFKPGVVYLDCQEKSAKDIATEIAKHLYKRRV